MNPLRKKESEGRGHTCSRSTDWVRMRFVRSRTADSTTSRVGSVGLKTHHLVAPMTGVLDGSDCRNCPWRIVQVTRDPEPCEVEYPRKEFPRFRSDRLGMSKMRAKERQQSFAQNLTLKESGDGKRLNERGHACEKNEFMG